MHDYDVIIIGAGPAGIFTALELPKKAPEKRILMIDGGSTRHHRVCPARTTGLCVSCKPCNIMNGWAGAGAFSDGKLSLSEEVGGNLTDYMTADQAQAYIRYADQIYLRFGAPEKVYGLQDKKAEEVSYEAKK